MKKEKFRMSVSDVVINDDSSVTVTGRLLSGKLKPGDILERAEVPTSVEKAPFLMPIEDVFYFHGRGTVACGRVERGVLHVGDKLQAVGLNVSLETSCKDIEQFRRQVDHCTVGQHVGIFVSGHQKQNLKRGMVLASPGTVNAYSTFFCECYSSQNFDLAKWGELMFCFRTARVAGKVHALSLVKQDVRILKVTLEQQVAMEEGQPFEMADGKCVARLRGKVTECIC